MLDKVLGIFGKGKSAKSEEKDFVSEVEEAIEETGEELAEVDDGEEISEVLGESERQDSVKKDKKGGLLQNKKLLIGAGSGLFLLLTSVLLMGGEEEEYYSGSPLDNIQATSPQPPSGSSQGAPSPGAGEAGGWDAPAPPPPNAPNPAGVAQGPSQAPPMAPIPNSSAQTPQQAPSVPPAPPAGNMQPPPPPSPVGSSPVVQQIQKRVTDNPFVIKQVDRLVREAIQRVLEEERDKIKKEIEALKGESSSALPSNKGPIKIGLEDEEEKPDTTSEKEEPVPHFTNAVVASSVVEKNGELILITNVGVVKKGLTIGDGWKVVEVGRDFIVLEKEYYKLEGTKKVKKKKTEIVPYIFDFSAKS